MCLLLVVRVDKAEACTFEPRGFECLVLILSITEKVVYRTLSAISSVRTHDCVVVVVVGGVVVVVVGGVVD